MALAPRAHSSPPRPRRVLVVDDNQDAAHSTVLLLNALGHQAQSAHNGWEALRLAAHMRPEVIFLDLALPDIDGIELGRRLRAELGAVRIFALTGYGSAEDRARTTDAGFDGHVLKPVQVDFLRSLLGASRNAAP